jgi:alpha-1,2-mannosyltransferase
MAAWVDTLRTGAWLGRDRIRLWGAAMLAVAAAGIVFLLATADGSLDFRGRPLGTDFSNVYAAGTWVREGRPEAPFDPALQLQRERELFGAETPFYGWHYPPYFLFIARALAGLPYLAALLLWQVATLALYLAALRAILAATAPDLARDPLWLLLALAFPAVFVNLGHGHNGFLTAALLGGGLACLDRRPVIAGLLFSCLVYKPQFGLMLPLVLAASGRWRAFFAAAAGVLALTALTTLAFGTEVWRAFLASTEFTRAVVLEAGDTGWHKIQSLFAWTRMWGGAVPLAYAVQGTATLAVAAALGWLWHRSAPFPRQASALAIGTLLATPYALDYDLMALAPAIAFLAAHGKGRGFAPFEKSVLAALWLVPLLARPLAESFALPLAVPLMIAAFAINAHAARAAP